jgi:hypothetical protein
VRNSYITARTSLNCLYKKWTRNISCKLSHRFALCWGKAIVVLWDGRNRRVSQAARPLRALSCGLHDDILCHTKKQRLIPNRFLHLISSALVGVESNFPITPRNTPPPFTFLLSLLGYLKQNVKRTITSSTPGSNWQDMVFIRKPASCACVG